MPTRLRTPGESLVELTSRVSPTFNLSCWKVIENEIASKTKDGKEEKEASENIEIDVIKHANDKVNNINDVVSKDNNISVPLSN